MLMMIAIDTNNLPKGNLTTLNAVHVISMDIPVSKMTKKQIRNCW